MMTVNFFTKVFLFMNTWLPSLWQTFVDYLFVKMSKEAFPHQPKEWGLLPAPSIAVTTPMIADELYPLLRNGFATPVTGIRAVTGPKQVTLTDGRVLDDIDSIVYCTGYYFDVPKFVPAEYHPYPDPDKQPYLYRNIFPLHPDPEVRNSLAFTGQVGYPFPGFVQFEFYTLAIAQIWKGNKKLPPLKEMVQWHTDKIAEDEKLLKKYGHARYAVFTRPEDMFSWVHETTGIGLFEHTSFFSWRSWQLWWSDPKFYKLLTTGLFSPAIWRLFDMGGRKCWPEAKQQIIKDNEFAAMRAKRREAILRKERGAKKTI
jgi:dimethylaniline monooxygenase (N-oxide forming)